MDNFGSTVGRKMHSAVRAKLLELGTGGSTNYIDDELPDYVMIMVANKRPKEQMIQDLALFLGEQTDLFVTWLHEVLHKLEEVTLPAITEAAAGSKKRKSSKDAAAAATTATSSSSGKKDKKTSKRDRDTKLIAARRTSEAGTPPRQQIADNTGAASALAAPINSITDVFAGELLVKAKKTLTETANASAHIKKTKSMSTNSFDIPTISEISSTTGNSRQKDLAELAEIQRKIYEAKKQLKQRGQLPANTDSDDEDFLKLKDDDVSDAEAESEGEQAQQQAVQPAVPAKTASNNDKAHSNIAETDESSLDKLVRDDQSISLSTAPSASPKQQEQPAIEQLRRKSINERKHEEKLSANANKRPVHERLGLRAVTATATEDVTQRERQQRQEKKLYVPAHRRQEATELQRSRETERQRHDRARERERERQRDREREHDRRIRERERERYKQVEQAEGPRLPDRPFSHFASSIHNADSNNQHERNRSRSNERERSASMQRQRIGSRIIVAPVKNIDTEEEQAKPINSVIKIKPRPSTSPSKQACKNLLLRAMAEAQRSTVLAKANKRTAAAAASADTSPKRKRQHSNSRSVKVEVPNQLYSRTIKQKQNFCIKVDGNAGGKKITERLGERIHAKLNEEIAPERMKARREHLETQLYRNKRMLERDDLQEIDLMETVADEVLCDNDYELYDNEPEDDAETLALAERNTQFVITIDDKTPLRLKERLGFNSRSHSHSPLPQVSSTSTARRHMRISAAAAANNDVRYSQHDIESSNSSGSCATPPRKHRLTSNLIEIYRKPKKVQKIIIKNDTEDEDSSPTKIKKNYHNNNNNNSCNNNSTSSNSNSSSARHRKRSRSMEKSPNRQLPLTTAKRTKQSTPTTGSPRAVATATAACVTPAKRKRTPIKFDLDEDKDPDDSFRSDNNEHVERAMHKRQNSSSSSIERQNSAERRTISIRSAEATKYDNIPALSSFAVDSTALKVVKPRERCKYHPNCTKQFCDYYHPTALCKSFPHCKFGNKCLYSHPQCKYDMACTNLDCAFTHSGVRNPSQLTPQAPPLSSHVVPVQNYKSISASTSSTAMCKYYPNCSKVGCAFFHPKPCHFGKNCINKLECNFYHHELQSANKFKWVASVL